MSETIDTLHDIATRQAKLDFSGSASLAELYLKKITKPALKKIGLSVMSPSYLEAYEIAQQVIEFTVAKKAFDMLDCC